MRNDVRRWLLAGGLTLVAFGTPAWLERGEAQEGGAPPHVVPPNEAWPALAPTEPTQALPTPVGRPRSIETAPNDSIRLWSFTPQVTPRQQYTPEGLAGKLLQVPISHNFPGGVAIVPGIENPYGKDPDAAKRGMQHFIAFNCVGCHSPNGGGGMGPSLSDAIWRFGSEPANIFLTIVHGRSTGMPAFGGMLPDKAIWELVAYVQSIAEKPGEAKGKTISRTPQSPPIEQVPAEALVTDNPWAYVEPFTNGRKPQMRATAERSLPGAKQAAPAPEQIPQAPAALLGAPPPLVVPEAVPQEHAAENPGNPPPAELQGSFQPPQSVQPQPNGAPPANGMPSPAASAPPK